MEPHLLTQKSFARVTRSKRIAHEEDLCRRLAQACRGRENHAALFSLSAERDPASGDTLLHWTDDFTGQTGSLGSLQPEETRPIVRALFEQLRAWRSRCENHGHPR